MSINDEFWNKFCVVHNKINACNRVIDNFNLKKGKAIHPHIYVTRVHRNVAMSMCNIELKESLENDDEVGVWCFIDWHANFIGEVFEQCRLKQLDIQNDYDIFGQIMRMVIVKQSPQ